MIKATDWKSLESATGGDLQRQVFGVLRRASLLLHAGDDDDPILLETVPRLARMIEANEELSGFKEIFSALARASGLWNYIDKDSADVTDALLAESVTLPELGGITLHREQVEALNDLLSGKNLILSAPTSFGKSLLIDALLASKKYKRIAIVLPTIALLDEFRRRIGKRFSDDFRIIMHATDVASDQPTIFLGTQERLINRTDLGTLDLTVVDEFYKLDPSRRDDRSVTLNAAVYKLLNKSRQFFFLGPNIDGVQVAGGGRWKFEFLKTRFSTVAVDTFDLRGVEDKPARLIEEIGERDNWPALVFVSSPDKANRLASAAADQMAVSDESADFAAWLRLNVGKSWELARAVEFGFGVHHGRVPRAIASHMVRLFNRGTLPVLFCTSTLIEGVNTAAKTVLIFDKSISRTNFDFFTFSNIKGRAGRLGQHHVGQVYLFNAPPDKDSVEVAPTLFGDDDEAPDDYVVHLDDIEVSRVLDDRFISLVASLGISKDELKLAASIGLESAQRFKDAIVEMADDARHLVWSGVPKYLEVMAVVNLICSIKKPNEFGVFSAKQLAFMINKLRFANTMREFLTEHDESYSGDPVGHDNIFKFLRACEYGLPQYFSVIELFLKKIYPEADYSLFLHDLSRWFMPEVLKNLDEEGVPIQISERFHRHNDDMASLRLRLHSAVYAKNGLLSSFEIDWLASALDIAARPEGTA